MSDRATHHSRVASLSRLLPFVSRSLRPSSRYRRHAIASSFTSIGLYGVGFVTGPILAHALGPSGRGDIAAVVAPASVLALTLTLGLPVAAAYFVDTVPEEELLLTATLFGLVVGAPICAVLWFFAPMFLANHSPATTTWARYLLLIVPLAVGTSAAVEIRRRVNPGTWNYWRSAPIVFPAIGTIILGLTGRISLSAVLALYFGGQLLQLSLLLARLQRLRPWKYPSFRTFTLIFPYAWRSAMTGTATSLTMRLDQVVLVAAVPPADLGRYAVAVTIASMTNPLTSGLSFALFGHLRGEADDSRALARFRRSTWMTLALSSATALALGCIAVPLLRVAFGPAFASASTALRLLLPGSVAFDVLGVLNAKLLSDGRPGEASLAALLGMAVTLVGLAAFVPRFGIEGAGAVTSIAFLGEVAFLVVRGALRPGQAATGRPATSDGRPPA